MSTIELDFLISGSILQINSNQYVVGWGKRTWFEKYHVSLRPFFYFPDFFLTHLSPWFQHEHSAVMTVGEIIEILPKDSFLKIKRTWKNPYINIFKTAVDDLKNCFHQGILQKAVPYIFEYSNDYLRKQDLINSLKTVLFYGQAKPLHVYGFWDKEGGILGASPEILFKYRNDHIVETIACAGTKSNLDMPHQLLKDSKELFEHQVVIQGIEDSLSSFGIINTGETQILKLSQLSHLITPITLEISKKMNILSLIKALHPTPALGAFPKAQGMKWLENYQKKIPRGRYGAPVGCKFNKQSTFVVGIRNIQWDRHGIKIGAGCGVVPDSVYEKEWSEICLKISSIKEMMAL